MLLAVPNFSEGRDAALIEAISTAFATGAALLDTHSDPIHNRTVLTLSGPPDSLAGALANGARACAEAIDMGRHEGAHPCIGALDVCPVVWLRPEDREAARAEALAAARGIAAAAGVPVFLYGELASHAVPSRAGLLSRRGAGGAAPAAQLRRAAARFRPGGGAPQRRRHAGHRARAAGGLQRRAGGRRDRGHPRDRRPPARVGRRAARGAGARDRPRRRANPGLDERARPDRRAAGRGDRAGGRAGRSARRPTAWPPKSSDWCPRPRWTASPKTCR